MGVSINSNSYSGYLNNNTSENVNFPYNTPPSMQTNYIPDKKHYPANFDMLFDPALLNTGPSLLDSNSNIIQQDSSTNPAANNQGQTNKKDHFDFVNVLMKAKK